MDLISQYSVSDHEDGSRGPSTPPKVGMLQLTVSTAPEVDTTGLVLRDRQAVPASSDRHFQDPTTRTIFYNLPVEDLDAPVLGPVHPYSKDGISQGLKNHRSGYVQDTFMHPQHFEEQYNTFQSQGYAMAPTGQHVVRNQDGAGLLEDGGSGQARKRQKTAAEKKAEAEKKAKRQTEEFDPNEPFRIHSRIPWVNKEVEVNELTEEQKAFMAQIEEEKAERADKQADALAPTTFFHGKEEKDYQGRSWMAEPKDRRKESDTCFLPKRWIHSWTGHTKGVNAIRFFPKTGHLLLSAGMDGKIKIWDVFKNQKCMRTYLGHSKGVKGIEFSNDGRRFVSTGYDKNVRIWDTETGQVVRTFNTGKIYYVAKFHCDDAKQNVLMGGCGDKKIYQWDLDTGDLVQEYNYHLGGVNTITFVEEGRRFVSSSDDKTLRVWEFGIPVQIKYIADPGMHSIPAISLSPNNNYFIGQSLDNQVVTYSAKDRFRQNRKKTFKGHNTAGYACQVNFSPDGRYVMSGDSEGKCFFWEWQHPHRIVRTIKAHDAVCIGCEWNPMESSKVATCGWDGLIKYWD